MRLGVTSHSARLLAQLRLTRRLAALQRSGGGALTVTDGDVVISGSVILSPARADRDVGLHALLSACVALVLDASAAGDDGVAAGVGDSAEGEADDDKAALMPFDALGAVEQLRALHVAQKVVAVVLSRTEGATGAGAGPAPLLLSAREQIEARGSRRALCALEATGSGMRS